MYTAWTKEWFTSWGGWSQTAPGLWILYSGVIVGYRLLFVINTAGHCGHQAVPRDCRGVTMCFWEKLCSLPGGWWSLGHPGPSVRSLSALSSLSSLSQFAVQIVTFSLYVLVWKNSGKYWLYWTTRTMFKGMDDSCSLLPVISWHALLRMHSLLLSQYTGIALWLGGLRVRCHQAADLVLCVTTQLFVMCGSLKN